jgi:predicted PurR-regulated permease PerM
MDERLKSNMKLVLFIFSLILCVWLIKMLFPIITLIIIALLIVYLIEPLVGWLCKVRIPESLAAVIVFVIFFLFLLLLIYFIPPLIFKELSQLAGYLATDFKQYIYFILEQLKRLDLIYNTAITQTITTGILTFLEDLPLLIMRWLGNIATFKVPFLSELWLVFALFFLILFLLLDIDKIKATIVTFFPQSYHHEVLNVINIIDAKVGAYLRGNVLRCTIVGIATGLGLYFLGMPFALLFGIIAGLLNVIHNIGPVLAAVPAVLISLTPDTPHPLLVIGLYLVIQTIDPFILTPFLLGKAVDLRPITVIIAILCGAKLMGLLGLVIAIPFTAVLKVLINQYYLKKEETGDRKQRVKQKIKDKKLKTKDKGQVSVGGRQGVGDREQEAGKNHEAGDKNQEMET